MSGRAGDNSPLALFPLLVSRTRDFGKIHEVHSRWCDRISTAWRDMIYKNGWHLAEANLKLRLPFFANELLGSAHLHGPLGLVALASPESLPSLKTCIWMYLIESTYCWPQDTILDFCQHLRSVLEKAHSPFPSSYHFVSIVFDSIPCQLQAEQQSVCLACSRRPGAAWVTQKCKNNVGWRIWLTWSLFKVWRFQAIFDIGFPCQNCKKTNRFCLVRCTMTENALPLVRWLIRCCCWAYFWSWTKATRPTRWFLNSGCVQLLSSLRFIKLSTGDARCQFAKPIYSNMRAAISNSLLGCFLRPMGELASNGQSHTIFRSLQHFWWAETGGKA